MLTMAVLVLAAGCGMPIGYSAVILPQLYNSNDSLQMDLEFGSWFGTHNYSHSRAQSWPNMICLRQKKIEKLNLIVCDEYKLAGFYLHKLISHKSLLIKLNKWVMCVEKSKHS